LGHFDEAVDVVIAQARRHDARACLAATGDQLLVEIEGDRDPLIRADASIRR
jgi:hypothetical protein